MRVSQEILSVSVVAQSICSNISCWELPQCISQSTLGGRNGSNACRIIALVLARVFQNCDFPIPIVGNYLSQQWIKLICIAIEAGNMWYDDFRWSLQSRLLSVEEAAEILQGMYDIVVNEPIPVRLCDEHVPSTLPSQLQMSIQKEQNIALFIINDKTSLFIFDTSTLVYILTPTAMVKVVP